MPNGTKQRRTAQAIINQAIAENKAGERFAYAIAGCLVVVGLGVLIRGAFWEKTSALTLAGAIATAMFWPALRAARKIRLENIALRLLEAALSTAPTHEMAHEVIKLAVRILDGQPLGDLMKRPLEARAGSAKQTNAKERPAKTDAGEAEGVQA